MSDVVRQAEAVLEVDAVARFTASAGLPMEPWQVDFLWRWKLANSRETRRETPDV